MKTELLNAGWKLSVRTRKLAGGPKKYFTVVAIDEEYRKHSTAQEIIAKDYPQVRLTSGSYVSQEFTFAEFL